MSALETCIGFLPGNTAAKVAEHVKLHWERGKRIIDLVREQLGVDADALVPLINGGVTLTKLCGSMHDTCNSANLIAKNVRMNLTLTLTLTLALTLTLTPTLTLTLTLTLT